MKEVTDPALLDQLNGFTETTLDMKPPAEPQEVTDPEILKLLDGPAAEDVPQQPELKSSAGRTVLDQGLQGATFGFADEVMDPLGVAAAGLYENPRKFLGSIIRGQVPEVSPELNEEISNVRDSSRDRMATQMAERPGLSLSSNIAGGVLTGGAGASTKAGAALGNSIRSGNTAARIIKGAGAGAATAGLYGAGAAEDGKRLEGAGQSLLNGAALGAAFPAAGAALSSTVRGVKNAAIGATARSADELDTALSVIKQRSNQAYQAMRAAGANITPGGINGIINKIDTDVGATGKLNSSLHGDYISVMNDLKGAASNGPLSLEELDQFRQLLGDVVNKNTSKIDGAKPAAFKASSAIAALDDAVEQLSGKDLSTGSRAAIDTLNTARTEWARAKRFGQVADIVKRADGDANYLKRELKKLADDPKRTRGMSAPEVAALREASRLTGGEGIMKMLGKFGIDLGSSRIGNGVGAAVGAGVMGTASGGVAGVAAPIVGTAARYTQKALARGKAETLLNTIESGAPASAVPLANRVPKRLQHVVGVPLSVLIGQAAMVP